MMDFDQYSKQAIHFFSLNVPPLLRTAIDMAPDGFTLADFGCGDGNLIFALKYHGLLNRAKCVVGIDLSPQRIARFQENTGYRGILSDSQNVDDKLTDPFDIIVCTMVIEHVDDDAVLLDQIRRKLKPGGLLYITTVFKKPGAWYFRRSPDSRWVLDSTHTREYASRHAFEQLVTTNGYNLEQVAVKRLCPPLLHPVLRLINRVIPLRGINRVFLQGGPLSWLEKITIPIPRYREIQLIARSAKETPADTADRSNASENLKISITPGISKPLGVPLS
jgi:2-polyprenyl-3-methyl-5-hydroxy-6-metoxy-1,4-benzoquinol methylase